MAKTNVNYVHKSFRVDKHEKTVTCTLDYEIPMNKIPGFANLIQIDAVADFINRLIYQYGVKFISGDDKGTALRFRTQDIAFCSTEDEFDIELGKKLALTRAQKLAFRNTKYFYRDLMNIVIDTFGDLDVLGSNCEFCEYDCHNHEFELTNSTID